MRQAAIRSPRMPMPGPAITEASGAAAIGPAATGVAAAFVGVIQGVEYHSGNATAGLGYVFQSIIVAVVGGVLLGGGYGSAFGVFLGTMIYGIINVGIFYTGWSTDWVQLFLGVLLLCAVLANSYFRRFAMSAR